jgi:hypothetical protein
VLIDPKSQIPVYRQLVDQLCRAIEDGIYRPGEALPSQRVLAAEIRVNQYGPNAPSTNWCATALSNRNADWVCLWLDALVRFPRMAQSEQRRGR